MLYEIDWVVSDDTVVRPNMVVICGAAPEKHLENPPALAAEILSKSTALRDRESKRDLYESTAVGIDLLIDPDQRTLEFYQRSPTGD